MKPIQNVMGAIYGQEAPKSRGMLINMGKLNTPEIRWVVASIPQNQQSSTLGVSGVLSK